MLLLQRKHCSISVSSVFAVVWTRVGLSNLKKFKIWIKQFRNRNRVWSVKMWLRPPLVYLDQHYFWKSVSHSKISDLVKFIVWLLPKAWHVRLFRVFCQTIVLYARPLLIHWTTKLHLVSRCSTCYKTLYLSHALGVQDLWKAYIRMSPIFLNGFVNVIFLVRW